MGRDRRNGRGVYPTGDFALATWLTMHGFQLKSGVQRGREFRFVFFDPENRARDVCRLFPASEAARFDAAQRGLKKVLHG